MNIVMKTKPVMRKLAVLHINLGTPEEEAKADKLVTTFASFEGELDYEVIILRAKPTDKKYSGAVSQYVVDGLHTLTPARLYNIARQYASEEVRYLFLTNGEVDTQYVDMLWDWVLSGTGKVSMLGSVRYDKDELTAKQLKNELWTLMNLDPTVFDEQCVVQHRDNETEDHVKALQYISMHKFATSVKLWDTLGGLTVTSNLSELHYANRAKLMGYELKATFKRMEQTVPQAGVSVPITSTESTEEPVADTYGSLGGDNVEPTTDSIDTTKEDYNMPGGSIEETTKTEPYGSLPTDGATTPEIGGVIEV